MGEAARGVSVGPGLKNPGGVEYRSSFVTQMAALILVLVLAAMLFPLGWPGNAGAAEYTVTSTGDQVDEAAGSNGCRTAVETCTLRAAIEESNASTTEVEGVNDTIKFSTSFNGQAGDTIALTSSLPTIVDRVRINGFQSPAQCETDYFAVKGPCVGVDGPPAGAAFRVEAESVVLIGFAISNAKTGIEAVDAPGLRAWNDWLGLKLDGSAGPVATGIHLDQGSNGAWIGGGASVARNIFAHNTAVGLDIHGADGVLADGNGFGVLPDGNTPAPNGKNIEITDAAAGPDPIAQENWIGRTFEGGHISSPICDGPCNVISGALESGIDLQGDGLDEKPSSGSTRIVGNYIGLNAFGTTGVPNVQQGVLVGSASNVTIGGPLPGARNMINGGLQGIVAGSGAWALRIERNWIGLDPAGDAMLAPPTVAGVAIENGYLVEVTENRISMSGGTAIEQDAQDAVIRSNSIGTGVGGENLPGAEVGIRLSGACCNLVTDNEVANAGDHGVLIESSRNQLYGNRIEGSGAAGIRIQEPPPYGGTVLNEIGGDSAAEENTISGSGGAAIEIAQVTQYGVTGKNQVARNRGALNGDAFIDLLGGANEGILPPMFSSSTQSGVGGEDAEPEATIRVFRKAGPSPGEIESFLAEAVADEGGDWEVTYPTPLPGGTMVAASQTTVDEGTSELALATTPEPPSVAPDGDGGSTNPPEPRGAVRPTPPSRDTTAPHTFILKGPGKRSRSSTAKFRFESDEPSSSFRCRLDRRPARPCTSPRSYSRLKAGRHVFKVWAIDASGNTDKTPAKFVVKVIRRR